MSDAHSALRILHSASPPTPSTIPFRVVVTLVVSIGLFAQVAQIVMFREMLATCRGTEVFFGVILAAGLLWTALGSVAAGLFARRVAGTARCWAYAAALFALNGLLLIGQIAIARHRSAAWGGAAELTFLEAVATAVVATGPVAFLSGVEFVLALNAARADDFSKLYQADAWGAVAGGLLFTFALVGVVDPVTLGPALSGGLCLLVATAGAWRAMAPGAAIGLAAAAAAWAAGLDARLHEQRWRALYPGFKLCATKDSRYGQLAVLKHPSEEQHSLYIDGGLVESLSAHDTSTTDERNQALFFLAQHRAPKHVLLVGKALGCLPIALLECGAEGVDALEMDPDLLRLAFAFARPRPDSRLRFHFADARRFIKGMREPTYDLIVLSLPDPLSAFVNRLYTVEFFREARAIMTDEGVLITSVTAAANYVGETVGQLSASVLRTLQAVFPEVLVAPGEYHTFIAAAKAGTVSLNPAVLARRIAPRSVPLDSPSAAERELYARALFENLVAATQVEPLRQTLEALDAPVNSDTRPITYQLALLVWNQVVSSDVATRDPGLRSGTNALFRCAFGLRFVHGLLLPVVVLVPGLALLALAHRGRLPPRGVRAYGLVAVAAVTGLFGMASAIILIYSFQSARGHAYAEVGLLVASFMVGLALGARAVRRWEGRAGALPAIVAAMAAYCLLLPSALKGLASVDTGILLYGAFVALVFAGGFLDGATFPPLVQALRQEGFARPGGWVYAADLAGSGVGALATGALLVPILGHSAALLLIAFTLAAALAVLLLGTTRHDAAFDRTA